MGIGRREFLRLTAAALAGLAIDPLQAVAVNDNLYINQKLGIMFEKPAGWGFVAIKDFGKLRREQIIGVDLEESADELWEELGVPICVATKYFEDKPEFKGVFSPTITLNVSHKSEFEDMGPMTFQEMMELSEAGTGLILKDFKVVKRYPPFQIDNCTFYERDAEYLFEHTDLAHPLPAELKVLKAEHNGYYYDFNCHQSKAQNQTAWLEFEAFKSTIRLV